jgi:rhomboid family GlyGly-CTERM serine protease
VTRGAAGGFAWVGVALLLGAVALIGWPIARDALDWQPGLALREPWRALTAVGVHYSGQHLGVNLIGLIVTALFGAIARAPLVMALAWLVAWPLTQIGLLLKPELLHYGGLSGVLHAGIAVVVAWLLITGTRGQRWVAAAVAVGGIAKLLNEAPWGPALRHPAGWDIAIAPLAHSTGAIAGAVCATIAVHLSRERLAGDV